MGKGTKNKYTTIDCIDYSIQNRSTSYYYYYYTWYQSINAFLSVLSLTFDALNVFKNIKIIISLSRLFIYNRFRKLMVNIDRLST